jgi:hypothetical protein
VGVGAGDDSPSKRDRQPLFVPLRCSLCARPRLFLSHEATQKVLRLLRGREDGPTASYVDSFVDNFQAQ